MKHPPGIYAIAIDGPPEKPNGTLLVRILGQDQRRFAFRCEVVEVLAQIGRTAQVGAQMVITESLLKLSWQEPTSGVDSESAS